MRDPPEREGTHCALGRCLNTVNGWQNWTKIKILVSYVKPKFFGGLWAGHGWSWAGVVVQMVGRGAESREASSSQN